MERHYAEFLLAFDAHHGAVGQKNRPENRLAAVAIDDRTDFWLPRVCRNFRYFLGEGWNFYLFGTARNRDYLAESLPGWECSIASLDRRPITRESYNALLRSDGFWSGFHEDRVLIFQSDCIACQPLEERFLEYDIIGAPCGERGSIWNGGLTLRNPAACREAIRRHGGEGLADPEDVFFSQALRRIGAKTPPAHVAIEFAVETLYLTLPFGVHGTDKYYHGAAVAEKIVQQIRYRGDR